MCRWRGLAKTFNPLSIHFINSKDILCAAAAHPQHYEDQAGGHVVAEGGDIRGL